MTQLVFASASRLTALIRQCQVGCLELLDSFIARVERLDRLLNAVVVHDFDRTSIRRPAPSIFPIMADREEKLLTGKAQRRQPRHDEQILAAGPGRDHICVE